MKDIEKVMNLLTEGETVKKKNIRLLGRTRKTKADQRKGEVRVQIVGDTYERNRTCEE